MATAYVVDCSPKDSGILDDPTSPFSNPDDAIVVWCKCPHMNKDERLSIIFPTSGNFFLRLDGFPNINFVALVPGVYLHQKLHHCAKPRMINVNFVNINHIIYSSLEEDTDGHLPNPIEYIGTNNYDQESTLTLVVTEQDSTGKRSRKIHPINSNNQQRILLGQQQSAAEQNTSLIIDTVATFLTIPAGSAINNLASLSINAPNSNIRVAVLNDGVFNFRPVILDYGYGIVVAGSGSTRLYSNTENSTTLYRTTFPTRSAITATTSPVVVDRVGIVAEQSTSSNIAQRDNERPNSPSHNQRSFLFYDGRNISTNLSLNSLGFNRDNDNRIIVNSGNPLTIPFVQIHDSIINGTGLSTNGVQLYSTNNIAAVISSTDFIASKPYPVIDSEITGPITASYGSSSPVWNGSTFLAPIIIRENYTHSRLDGTTFYIDAEGGSGRGGRRTLGVVLNSVDSSGEKCDNHQCEKITITLPSGSTTIGGTDTTDTYWHGRIVKYKRIDCSNAEVNIILALERSGRCLKLSPGESVELQNVEGRYYVLSKLRGYV